MKPLLDSKRRRQQSRGYEQHLICHGGNGMDPIGREDAFAVLVGSEFSKLNNVLLAMSTVLDFKSSSCWT
jgi:hypothetical protein